MKKYVCILTFFFLPINCILSRQLLGFDIILRADMEPFLLEVNHSPSFHTPSEVDASVKLPLLQDTLTMLNVQPLHRRALARRISEQVQCRLYGDTFDSSQRTRHIDDDSDDDSPGCGEKQNSSAKARRAAVPPLPTPLTASWAWEMHLQSEASNLSGGKFDLIYPADVYESQPAEPVRAIDSCFTDGKFCFSLTEGIEKNQYYYFYDYNEILNTTIKSKWRPQLNQHTCTKPKFSLHNFLMPYLCPKM